MEKRSIRVDYETAKEWFNGNNQTLKELALQAFSEAELIDIKRGDIVFATTASGLQKFIFINDKEDHPSINFGIFEDQWNYEDRFQYKYFYKRKATKEEIKLYKDILLENGYLYEDNQLIRTRKRKRVAKGCIYYTITSKGEIVSQIELNSRTNNQSFNIGNYFTSREEAEIYLNKFLQILKE